jgi:hypothetical protein
MVDTDWDRSAACFFIDLDKGERSAVELAALAKIEEPYLHDANDLTGRWGGLNCKIAAEKLGMYQLLEIQWHRWDFDRLRRPKANAPDLPLEEDPALPIALAFRDTCLALEAEAAFMITWGHRYTLDWVRTEGLLSVLALSAHRLASELFGLLYLNKVMADELKGHWLLEGREQMPVEGGGLLLFRGRGYCRWYL